ncbi:MAG TPA: hypothetical protein VGN16_06650 [Acidobacteriaceae bacterium]
MRDTQDGYDTLLRRDHGLDVTKIGTEVGSISDSSQALVQLKNFFPECIFGLPVEPILRATINSVL